MSDTANGAAGAYFEVLRPAGICDLEEAGRDVASVLERLPAAGYVTAGDLEGRCGREVARRALEWACGRGMLRKAIQDGTLMGRESVRFWITQLNSPKTKNITLKKGTRRTYADALGAFSEWLQGRRFPARRDSGLGGRMAGSRAFQDVEDLLGFCMDSDDGVHAAKRVVREHLADLAASKHSLSTAMVRCAAVKSYFATHDVPVDVRVNKRLHAVRDVRDLPEMSLFDLYKMMTVGSMGAMLKAVMMIKFQAGLDASTFADRFNFEAYPQIVKHFGIEDYEAWDLGRCPVPIRLVRVKTGMEYTTFIDRDAVSHLQDYLRWREFGEGRKHDPSEPLFVTRRGTPVSPNWISSKFSKAAINAGIQKEVSYRVYKIHSHEVRDLLKSTLLVSGCAQHAADHVLGHAPRDSYEKQAILYPEALRSEYAKASGRLNIFTNIERHLKGADAAGSGPREGAAVGGTVPGDDRYRRIEEEQHETRAALQKLTGVMTDVLRMLRIAGRDGNPGAVPDDVAAGRDGNPGAVPDDVVNRLMGLDGDGEDE